MSTWADLTTSARSASVFEAMTYKGDAYAYKWGVRGDGVTHSAAALQACINDAKARSVGTVWLPAAPAGSPIMLESQIWVPDGIRVVGTGRRGTILKAISGLFPINTAVVRLGNPNIVPAPPNDVAFDCRLENLGVHCASIAGSWCVDANGMQEGAGLEHVGMYGFLTYAALVNSSQNFRLFDLECYGDSGSTPACIQVNGCIAFTIEWVTANPANTTTGIGVAVSGCTGVTLRQIHSEQSKYGIWSNSGDVVVIGAVGSSSCNTLLFFHQNNNTGIAMGLSPNGSPNTLVDDNTGYTGGIQFYVQSYAQFGTGYQFATSPDSRPVGFQVGTLKVYSSTTANRQSAAAAGNAAQAFDSTLHKPIWSDGTNWRDASGAIV